TDNAGVAVIDQPELLGREVWFHVASPGYAVEPDGFGYRGVRLTPKVGAELRVEVRRTAIARRLGRLTGAGLLAESQKLGVGVAATESGVFGCDSIQLAEHRGRLFWLWGDTKLAKYPLGVFDCTAATTPLRPGAQWEPPISLPLDYFVDDQGTPRGVADIPGEGPTWISALVSLPDAEGAPRLAGVYSKIRNLLEAYEVGLCLWDEEREMFVRERVLWTKSEEHPEPPLHPDGHVVKWKDESGRTWLLAGNPLPKFRCRATLEAWRDPDRWEPLDSQPELSAAADGAADNRLHAVLGLPFGVRRIVVFRGRPADRSVGFGR
ncbi:MAG TPA: hypothetical protein PKC18_00200, partial [Lacipirellulaceae bacterium]|nr:hypothetical protein [Lacipirellulaceae bacterium]